jgi:hypothetical protein
MSSYEAAIEKQKVWRLKWKKLSYFRLLQCFHGRHWGKEKDSFFFFKTKKIRIGSKIQIQK